MRALMSYRQHQRSSSGGSARQQVVTDASYGSGSEPNAVSSVSTADVRSELNAAGIGPQVCSFFGYQGVCRLLASRPSGAW